MTSPVSTQQREGVEYALDTARAKTPAERLRIVADLMEACERGEQTYELAVDGNLYAHNVDEKDATRSYRYVTKRRPALVIPALELFEGPVTEEPNDDHTYYVPEPASNCGHFAITWDSENLACREYFNGNVVFRTKEGAAAVGLHIRNELAKAVAQ